jgi:hypothetical protein
MTDPFVWATVSGATLTGLTVVAVTALKGWRDWIALQRLGIEGRGRLHSAEPGAAGGMARIELSDLKERVRKLEQIAAGVDL